MGFNIVRISVCTVFFALNKLIVGRVGVLVEKEGVSINYNRCHLVVSIQVFELTTMFVLGASFH